MEDTESTIARDYYHLDAEDYELNNTNGLDYTSAHIYKFPKEYHYFLGCAAVFLFVLGVFGNTLTLVAIPYDKKLRRNKASWFVASLSASDLVSCITQLPLNILEFFEVGNIFESTNPIYFCKIVYYTMGCTIRVSLMSLLLITLNRYVAIVHNPWYSRLYGTKSVVVQISLIWLITYTATIPFLFDFATVITIDPKTLLCGGEPIEMDPKIAVLEIILKMMAGTPWHCIVYILVMIGCYIRIYLYVRQSRINVESYGGSRAAKHSGNETELKLAKTMMITLAVLLVSAVPLVGYMLNLFNDIWYGFGALTYVTGYSTCTTNFLIYAVWHPQYRKVYIELLRKPGAIVKRIML